MTQKIISIKFSMLIPRFQKNRGIEDKNSRGAWLQERIEIFNRVTSPSLKQHDDVSILIFLAEDDQWVYDQLDCDDRYIPIYSDKNAVEELFNNNIKNIINPGQKAILMRMDSDDAIHKDYFVGIDDSSNLNTYVINPVGVLWNGSQGAVVDMSAHQFVTVYTNTLMSPFGFFHTSVLKQPHTILNKRDPMWLTYVHGNNVGNQALIRDKKLTDIDVSGFGIT